MIKVHYSVIVIGGGQAGLSTGYFLQQAGLDFMILDRGSYVGQSWAERYDSLKLFSPNDFNSLPGLAFPGSADAYADKDVVVEYLQTYLKKFQLPIMLNETVRGLEKKSEQFLITTNHNIYYAKNVLIATGPFQVPYWPTVAKQIDANIFQLHSSEYKNPEQIPKGKILIVGAGNSGAQIAVELSKTHDVIVSSRSKLKFIPYKFLGKSWLWWAWVIGILHVPVYSTLGRWFIKRNVEPIIGLELKSLIESGRIELWPELSSTPDHHLAAIIWATGFEYDFSWLKIPGALNPAGLPIQKRGISNIFGLYYVGLKYQTTISSGLMRGAGIDARFVVQKIKC